MCRPHRGKSGSMDCSTTRRSETATAGWVHIKSEPWPKLNLSSQFQPCLRNHWNWHRGTLRRSTYQPTRSLQAPWWTMAHSAPRTWKRKRICLKIVRPALYQATNFPWTLLHWCGHVHSQAVSCPSHRKYKASDRSWPQVGRTKRRPRCPRSPSSMSLVRGTVSNARSLCGPTMLLIDLLYEPAVVISEGTIEEENHVMLWRPHEQQHCNVFA